MQEEKSSWKKNFSSRLKNALKGHKQTDVAAQVGVGQSALSGYANESILPSLETFRALCLSLGVKPDYLLDLSADMVSPTPSTSSSDKPFSDSFCTKLQDANRKIRDLERQLRDRDTTILNLSYSLKTLSSSASQNQ